MKRGMIVAIVMTVAIVASAAANDKKRSVTKQQAKKSTALPVGRGPAAGMQMASIADINKRGHVNNICEAHHMMMDMVSRHGGQQAFGDYTVAYMIGAPKGWYELSNGVLTWRPPAPTETVHLEAVILDTLTGKPIPMEGITMDVVDASGVVVQSQPLAYYWHPMADHYGANFSIPSAGTYTLRIKAPMPSFRRHDVTLGDRFTTPLDASFPGVALTPMTPEVPAAPVPAEPAAPLPAEETPPESSPTPTE